MDMSPGGNARGDDEPGHCRPLQALLTGSPADDSASEVDGQPQGSAVRGITCGVRARSDETPTFRLTPHHTRGDSP